ncbi:hypothetical protein HYC85_000104 [Camellia sinensis]|uniref:Tubulin-specific chaperone A n=1 Tax=Camellia sinensis TaxID=4442 RepID=A0A7J7FP89_CAMSI|nr:hypothetical protein HYC85_000104 [Camellia sinensis]
MNMQLDQQIPMLLVKRQALNEAIVGEKNVTNEFSPFFTLIREDVNSGVYVENLTKECVSTMKDVTQLLMKGNVSFNRLNMATLRNLKIKTSTCKRIVKEMHSYEKEVEREAAKTADMKEKGADPYDLKQQVFGLLFFFRFA